MLHIRKPDNSIACLPLDLAGAALPTAKLRCCWSPNGSHITVAYFPKSSYHTGQGALFEATSGIQLVDFDIGAAQLWPQWPPFSADALNGFNNVSMGPNRSLCFVPDLEPGCGLVTFIDGDADHRGRGSGSPWTQMSGSALPDTLILVTLMVKDGRFYMPHSMHRQPGRLDTNQGIPVFFEHVIVQGGLVSERAKVMIECADHQSKEGVAPQGHPFRMSWLPGTNIYAAAALGHIWVIGGRSHTQLMCWKQADLDMMPVTMLKGISRGSSSNYSSDHGEPVECSGLSFSPDRSCLAWAEGNHWTIVSFGPSVAVQGDNTSPHGPALHPHTHHSKACRHLPMRD